jgi:hypothetical protein
LEFDNPEDFDNFKNDEERKKFMVLKEKPIQSSILIKGTKV